MKIEIGKSKLNGFAGKITSLSFVAFFFFLPTLFDAVGQSYLLLIFLQIIPLALFALSLDLLLGYTGLLNFGQTAFFGLGAYVVGYSLTWTGMPYPVSLLLACLIAVGLGVAISFICCRTFHGVPFTFITLAVAMVLTKIYDSLPHSISGGEAGFLVPSIGMLKSSSFSAFFGVGVFTLVVALLCLAVFITLKKRNISGGRKTIFSVLLALFGLFLIFVAVRYLTGLMKVTPPFRIVPNKYYLFLSILCICYFGIKRIVNSPVGHVWVAIRESETRAEMLGYNTFKYKMLAVIVSGIIAALAGAIYAPYTRTIVHVEVFSPLLSIEVILFVILGGIGTLNGPLLGAGIAIAFDRILHPYLGDWTYILMGCLFIGVVLLFPYGIVGTWKAKGLSAKTVFRKLIEPFYSFRQGKSK
jgi:ABC-type branched-subunit amino acid transport system permease subunit